MDKTVKTEYQPKPQILQSKSLKLGAVFDAWLSCFIKVTFVNTQFEARKFFNSHHEIRSYENERCSELPKSYQGAQNEQNVSKRQKALAFILSGK